MGPHVSEHAPGHVNSVTHMSLNVLKRLGESAGIGTA